MTLCVLPSVSLSLGLQSLLATRVRTVDLVEGAKLASQLLGNAFSLEVIFCFVLFVKVAVFLLRLTWVIVPEALKIFACCAHIFFLWG